jgi:alpha,alpha-trehalase
MSDHAREGSAHDQARRHAEDNAIRVASVAPADTLTPADRYQELFVAVQTARVFPDSKTFVDCAPLRPPEEILEAYRACEALPDFDLGRFVQQYFRREVPPENCYVSDPDQALVGHIDGLWDVLTRHPREHPSRSSLLPLPNRYVVPGGRFGELYYWDSYFTMVGLVESGRPDLLRTMADNFAYLIDTYGHVPNGNRSYYLSRSQPPVFALMVDLFETHGIGPALRYLPRLRAEHAFWMDGLQALRPGEAARHCVRMPDGSILNRYWDDRAAPREEMYLEDVVTARGSRRPAAEVHRDLRAAAASGWDFSSRWCDADGGLASTRTTTILPVDLNCFLHALELQIARLSAACGEDAAATTYRQSALARHRAIDRWLWNEAQGAYLDFDLLRDRPRDLCAATTAPLFVGIAGDVQAARVADAVRTRLLRDGGIATTLVDSGEQWDQPNGWAPLQWLAIRGVARYGHAQLSREIGRRWLGTVGSLYERESKLVEKYTLDMAPGGAVGGGGGEYPLQDGFGWTNGVTRKLLHEEPAHPVHHVRAGACACRGPARGAHAS